MEGEITNLDYEDTLGILSKPGIGLEEVSCNNAASNARADDDNVVGFFCRFLGCESEEMGFVRGARSLWEG